jgi:hypothetical protein
MHRRGRFVRLCAVKLLSLSLVAGALVAPRIARADAPPTADAVKKALPTWTAAIAVPFTYQGLDFENDDVKKVQACNRDFDHHGVIKDAKKVPAFLECLKISNAGFAMLGKPDVGSYDPKKPASEMTGSIDSFVETGTDWFEKGWPGKLAKLGKDKAFVVAHTSNPSPGNGPWDEAWNVWAAHSEGGAVKFDAVLVVESIPSPD